MGPASKAIFVLASVIVVAAVLYAWSSSPMNPMPDCTPKIVFSEPAEKENNSGIFEIEVIEAERTCGFVIWWNNVNIHLLNPEGEGIFETYASEIIDNYDGNVEELKNQSVIISEDNGTEFPIRLNNHGSNETVREDERCYQTPQWCVAEVSIGDKFLIYGSEAGGPVTEGWKLRFVDWPRTHTPASSGGTIAWVVF